MGNAGRPRDERRTQHYHLSRPSPQGSGAKISHQLSDVWIQGGQTYVVQYTGLHHGSQTKKLYWYDEKKKQVVSKFVEYGDL